MTVLRCSRNRPSPSPFPFLSPLWAPAKVETHGSTWLVRRRIQTSRSSQLWPATIRQASTQLLPGFEWQPDGLLCCVWNKHQMAMATTTNTRWNQVALVFTYRSFNSPGEAWMPEAGISGFGIPQDDHASLQWRHNECDSVSNTSLTIVYSTAYSGAIYQRKHQSSASLAFMRGIYQSPVNSLHKGPVTRKMFPFDDVIMLCPPPPPPKSSGLRRLRYLPGRTLTSKFGDTEVLKLTIGVKGYLLWVEQASTWPKNNADFLTFNILMNDGFGDTYIDNKICNFVNKCFSLRL